jgi:hypothetical protein
MEAESTVHAIWNCPAAQVLNECPAHIEKCIVMEGGFFGFIWKFEFPVGEGGSRIVSNGSPKNLVSTE